MREYCWPRTTSAANEYVCAIEKTQNGKYNVRVRAAFGRGAWTLPVYFLASSFNGAMKKLEESLQLLQKNEERLRFWSVEHSDDPNMAGDLLQEFGLGSTAAANTRAKSPNSTSRASARASIHARARPPTSWPTPSPRNALRPPR